MDTEDYTLGATDTLEEIPMKGIVGAMDQLALDSEPTVVRLKSRRYLLETQVGAGNNGSVYRATREGGSRLYAVKIFEKRPSTQPLIWNHKHIVKFDSFTDCFDLSPALVMEYMELGSLRQHAWSLDATEIATILKQTLEACSYLHAFNFVHSDIKPANILVQSTSPVHIKLADMDGVKRLPQAMSRGGYTRIYAAPEVLLSGACGTPQDIWSIGIMSLELLVLKELPRQKSVKDWPRCIHSYLKFLSNSVVYGFMSKLLELRPQRRLTAQKALAHPFWSLGSSVYDEMRPWELWKDQQVQVDDNIMDTASIDDTEPMCFLSGSSESLSGTNSSGASSKTRITRRTRSMKVRKR